MDLRCLTWYVEVRCHTSQARLTTEHTWCDLIASLPLALGVDELSGSNPIGSESGTFDAITGVTECWPFIHRDSDFPGVEIR
jgi:hypothetical protein